MIKYLMLVLLFIPSASKTATFEVDNSYTINQRFVKNHTKYPELKLPILNFTSDISIEFNLVYSTDNGRELNLDIFQPTTRAAEKATILLVHGGGWRSGTKSHMYALANKLAQQGFTAIPIEYRLSIEAPYPKGLEDINKAIVWLKKNAAQYNINATNMLIAGGSSGGHMAALIAYSAETKLYKTSVDDTKLSGVIVLDGVLDFTSEMGLKYENKRGEKSAAALWLGGSYERIPERWKEASPIFHINEKSPPLLFISSGNMRFQAGLINTRKKSASFNIPVVYHQFEAPHTFWLFEPWLSSTVEHINQFILAQR